MKWFLDLATFSKSQLEDLLQLAQQLDVYPEPNALSGKVMTMLMLRHSFHTRASMGAAMARLGGKVINIGPSGAGWEIETGERAMDGSSAHHALEMVPSMGAYSDVLGIRAPGNFRDLGADLREDVFSKLCKACPVPMVNLESAINHPCQSLGDWKTLNDRKIPAQGGKLVLSWSHNTAPHPFGVTAATLHMAALRGMRISIYRPDEYALPPPLIAKAQRAAAENGGSVTETNNRIKAFEAAHVVYAESWVAPANYGNLAAEHELRKKYSDWCIDETWFHGAVEDSQFMHALPVRRGISVDDDILDGPRSLVLKQARNRMLAQMAVLYRMLKQ